MHYPILKSGDCTPEYRSYRTSEAILYLSGYGCQLRRSMQHFVEVYSLEFGILKFFWDADLTAAPLCPDPLAYSRTGQFSSGSIAAGADWCFRWCRVARDFVDRRSRLAPSSLP